MNYRIRCNGGKNVSSAAYIVKNNHINHNRKLNLHKVNKNLIKIQKKTLIALAV